MNNQHFFRSLRRFLLITVILAFAIWVGLYSLIGNDAKTPRDEMLIELSKALAQLIFISLVGAFASFLYNQYAKDLDRYHTKLQEDDKNRRELLDALIHVRAEVEKARRNYRLIQIQDPKEAYRRTIEGLLDARLELSQVWHDILTLQQLYPGNGETIQEGLTGMKKFLDNLVDEYESHAKKINRLRNDAATREIKNLPCFAEFVTGDGGTPYTQKFLEENYRNSARLMRQQLFLPAD